mmetsp:Transcript_10354/g.15820  ORF Transcript_10354/g.15820 Transcript_10354/m.15820 type:complete len:231 (-) Transcript_10354:305-997(-)|eukprot:CAMPEP_0194241798 /NCGR_PEP_ID=MMETSP0158-20130606/7545_1 /TAXON_ID=33649 /ORGANISM="Thalassionema nitzschioides, Strain L26-B" /LENGTH=230 /DNA_ID=CAMNT_0038976757 /DNA_START=107 /DNA_END=799 /DNA_ORIENTATION=-
MSRKHHLKKLEYFYDKVDKASKEIIQKSTKEGRLNCKKGCSSCCVGGIFISQIEAEYIRTNVAKKSLLEGKKNNDDNANDNVRRTTPTIDPSLEALVRDGNDSRCSFVSSDSNNYCTIYKYRPFACRFMGLPLRWLEECNSNAGLGEARDICPINENCLQEPIEELPRDQCYAIDDIWEDELDMLNYEYVTSTEDHSFVEEQNEAVSSVHPSDGEIKEIELNDLYDRIAK